MTNYLSKYNPETKAYDMSFFRMNKWYSVTDPEKRNM